MTEIHYRPFFTNKITCNYEMEENEWVKKVSEKKVILV